jgi:hypothetical protein
LSTSNDFDTPWKDVIEHALPDLFAFFFPAIHAEIDWEKGYEFLDKELQQITPDGETGRRIADKLIKVFRRDGSETWILIHLEVQNQRDPLFAKRMYTYHYRIVDRYQRDVISLAILGDTNLRWRPTMYRYDLWGCVVTFQFPIVKLLDYRQQQAALLASRNPFATVVLAHLAAQQTSKDVISRSQLKFQLTRRLYDLGYTREQIINLYRFIDWVLRLPEDLDNAVWYQLRAYEEAQQMTYISTAERIGRAEGRAEGKAEGRAEGRAEGKVEGRAEGKAEGRAEGKAEGRAEGLELGRTEALREMVLRLAQKRFGALSSELTNAITKLALAQLDELTLLLLDFATPADLEAWLRQVDPAASE